MYIHAEENVTLFALGQCEENPGEKTRQSEVSPNGGDGLIGDPHPVAAAKSGASGIKENAEWMCSNTQIPRTRVSRRAVLARRLLQRSLQRRANRRDY